MADMIRRHRAALLSLVGVVGICLCGCDNKEIDSSLGDDRTTYIYGDVIQEDAGMTLAAKLKVPTECDITFDTGKSKLTEIRLADKDIVMSDTDRAYVVDFDRITTDKLYIQNMVESIFDKSSGIYCRDEGDEYMTKEEIQHDIDIAEVYRQQALKDGQADVAEMYENDIEDMKSRQKEASDTYTPVSGYTMNKIYVGERDGERYSLWISGQEDTDRFRGISIMYSEAGDQEINELARVDDAVYVDTVPESAAEASVVEMQNLCTMTENSAASEAMAFLAKLGISGVACVDVEPAVRRWQNGLFDTIEMEKNGYVFDFQCQIGGIDVLYKDPTGVDNLANDKGYIMQEGDRIAVYIDDDGVFYMSARLCTDTDSFDRREVSLMGWDDMITAADKSIAEYYRKYPTAYSRVEFNKVELLYVPEAEDDGSVHYVPAWVFTQTDKEDILNKERTHFEHISQMVYINAIDGKYIDIIETAKVLGTWDSYGREKEIAP